VIVVILVISSIVSVKPTFAQIPKSSVPEFTVKLVGPSFDVNSTSSLDNNTDRNATQTGYHSEYSAVEVSIKNQPYTPYYDANSGLTMQFYYNT
jgi:hypothetical protein